jgi:uncharacterized protein (TIGR00251 family)
MNPAYLQSHNDGVIVAVRVTPKSSQSKIIGPHGDELKITLNAPPVDGKANKELIRLLSKTFHIPKTEIHIVSGETSRSKKLLLSGCSVETVLNTLD